MTDAPEPDDHESEDHEPKAQEPSEPTPASGNEAMTPADEGDELVLPGELACNLLSEHGGEIVILDDGRVVFMNANAHLVELAHALDPDNADVAERLRRIEEAAEDGVGA